MENNKKTESWRIEDQDWWKKYSAMVHSQEIQVTRNIDSMIDIQQPSGSGSRYVGSGSGSLGIRYVGSGSGSLGIRYVGSGSGSLGIRYVGSGSGSLGIRYVGSGSGITYTGSVPVRVEPEQQEQDPYGVYDRSRFPGETSGSDDENGILGYGIGLI